MALTSAKLRWWMATLHSDSIAADMQMDAFVLTVKNNKTTIVPGEMGRRDVKYLQAIYEAMRTGKRILIK